MVFNFNLKKNRNITEKNMEVDGRRPTEIPIKPSAQVCPLCFGKGLIEPTNPAYRGSNYDKYPQMCHSCYGRGIIIVK